MVGCSQQEMVVGHVVAGWQSVNSTTSVETLAEVSLPEKSPAWQNMSAGQVKRWRRRK